MSKDKAIGAAILVGALAVLVIYTLWLVGGYIQQEIDPNGPYSWALFFPSLLDWQMNGAPAFDLPWELAVIIPLWLVAVLILAIAMWIGYSMLTTPPPVPLEELEEELEAEEAEAEESE
jgi:hypothetical protein